MSRCVCVYLAQEQSRSAHLNSLGVSDLQRISGCLYQMAKQHGGCNYFEFNLPKLPKYRLNWNKLVISL